MALIKFPDGMEADISKDRIDLYFGDRFIKEMDLEEFLEKLRYQDSVHDKPHVYKAI